MNANIRKVLGILFVIAAFCFAIGTVNHIVNTGEGIVSSICFTIACVCGAIACFKRRQ